MDEMQGAEREGEGSVLKVHDRLLIAKATPQFAIMQRSLKAIKYSCRHTR